MNNPEEGRRRKLGAPRLVREGSFYAPDGYPSGDVNCHSPSSVYQFILPYAEREEVEVLLDSGAQRTDEGYPEPAAHCDARHSQ